MLPSRSLAGSGVQLTELSFGTSSIAGMTRSVSEAEAEAVMQAAWDLGIRYFDTAPHYGQGIAEQRLGRFMAGKAGEACVVSTKVGRLLEPLEPGEKPPSSFANALPFSTTYDYSYDGIMRSFEDSCGRLGGRIPDILYVHDIGRRRHGPDNERHMNDFTSGGIRALEELKRTGAIKAFGLGVNETEICLDLLELVTLDVILLANRYTLIDRTAKQGLLARCQELNVNLVIGGVFNSGVLAAADPRTSSFDYRPAADETVRLVTDLQQICERHGSDIVTTALNFPLRETIVVSVLVGTSRISSIADCAEKLGVIIPPALWGNVSNRLAEQQIPRRS
jgi:D-threo-aldose 1-dehydrogenase